MFNVICCVTGQSYFFKATLFYKQLCETFPLESSVITETTCKFCFTLLVTLAVGFLV